MTRRVVRGGAMEFPFDDSNISIEHIQPGVNLPEWLFDYQLKLAKWNDSKEQIFPRIMIIYSNEESRKQALSELNNRGGTPLDSSLHLTIPRLMESLHSDLRLPKLINDDGILFEIIHYNCVKNASEYGFPLLHSNIKVEWSRGKTKMLNQLHERICEENITSNWEDDPGIIEYENLLCKVEKQMSGTHPNLRLKKIINLLIKNEITDLFSLRDIDGIIIQDLSPTLSPLKLKLLQLLSTFKPIHQLCNPGSFRLGEHGAYLADVDVCKTKQSLPKWVPEHDLDSEFKKPEIFHLGLFNSSQTDEAIHNILSNYTNNSKENEKIMIIDPRPKESRKQWPRLFESLGIKLDSGVSNDSNFGALSWLGELMNLGDGQDAWSITKLKLILNQNNFSLIDNYLICKKHPVHSEYIPVADYKLLEETARTFHILGGGNSLNDWLYALSREKFDNPFVEEEVQRKIREQTQWWLLSLANFIHPLLNKSDRTVLENNEYYIGCNSKCELPRFNYSNSGDEWLLQTIQKLDWNNWMDVNTSDNSLIAIQNFISFHTNLRTIQKSSGIKPPFDGQKWVEESIELLNSVSISKTNISDSSIRVLSPQNALGCNAEIVLFIGLGNEDWDLSTPFFPWLDFEQLRDVGLLNPDKKIRAARHYYNHILSSGKQILLIDPSIDSKTYPCTPFAEWLNKTKRNKEILPNWLVNNESPWVKQIVKEKEMYVFNPEKIVWKDNFYYTSFRGSTIRSIKQSNGVIRKQENKKVPLLNEESPILIYEKELLDDRIKREPLGFEEEEDYLDWSERVHFVSSFNLKLIPPRKLPSRIVSPREYRKWPVIGRRLNRINSTTSIDPRPLDIKPVGIEILDKRSGHLDLIKIKKEILWSTSKLNKWIQCPRRGWLESELYLSKDETMDEDLDVRIRGKTLHDSFAELICSQLGFELGGERTNLSIKNISTSGISIENLMSEFVKILSSKTALQWLWRNDAMAVHRRRDFIGMSLPEFETWWEDDNPPITPKGRLGQMLISEFAINDSINLSFEWEFGNKKQILIEISESGKIEKFPLRGWIDRVDLVPFEDGTFYNENGDDTPAPFFLDGWQPSRLILIRDTKSVEGPSKERSGEKHEKGIFEDIQLALYARAWELANPGDLVIGVGISEAGDFTKHYLEVDPEYQNYLSSINVGILTNLTHDMYRFPQESIPPKSNPFRAWMYWKTKIALKASKFAENGHVYPTPGKYCDHCAVKNICR